MEWLFSFKRLRFQPAQPPYQAGIEKSTTVLSSYSYTLYPNGQRKTLTEHTGRVSNYVYDKLGRLTAETITDAINGNHAATYTYDKVGNRLTQTVNGTTTSYSYNANDWLLKAGAIAYTYDANGNTLTETDGSNVKQYAYNAENKLIKQTANGQSASFAYNPNGLRIAKTIGTTKTTYLLDGMSGYGDVVAEYQNGTKAKDYTLGDDLISQTVGGNTHYFGYDGLGSTRVLFDSTGTVSDSYDYTAFGEMHGETGTTDNEFKFTGEQYDSTLEMYNLRARYYAPKIGRFYGLDTYQGQISDPATLHKYLYTGNDPINMIDPSGHFGISMMGGMGNVMGSIAIGVGLRAGGSYIGRRTFIALIRYAGIQAVRQELKRCIKSRGKKCRIKTPIVVIGKDFETQRQHIYDAITGNGENFGGRRISAVLNYQASRKNRDSWPKIKVRANIGSPRGFSYSCSKNDEIVAKADYGNNVDCDEYPFSASKQGGYRNYKRGRVSLRFIPREDNQGFGLRVLSQLRGFKKGKTYIVAPVSFAPVSWIMNKSNGKK